MVDAAVAASPTPSAAPRRAPVPITEPDGAKMQRPGYPEALKAMLDSLDSLGGKCKMVMVGDSITHGFPLKESPFAKYSPFNYGQPGDSIQDAHYRLTRPELSKIKPKVVVIMLGTNNMTATGQPKEIADGVRAVVTKTQAIWPGAHIILMGILPNGRNAELAAKASELIAKMDDGKTVHYLNIRDKFVPEGDNWKYLKPDKVHLLPDGYKVWTEALEPVVSKLMN